RCPHHLHSFPTRRSSDLRVWHFVVWHLDRVRDRAPRDRRDSEVRGCAGHDPLRAQATARRLPRRSALARAASDRAITEWLLPLRSEEHTSELQSRENLVC